jgi:hypothetical protein
MEIVLINQSTEIDDAEVARIAAACNIQLQNDVGPAWNIEAPLSVTTGKSATKDSFPFYFVDEIPEAPDALAYHDVEKGIPTGRIGVKPTLAAGETVSSATSHEAVELQCDIYCASWSFSNRLRCLVATEACDPVQNDTYTITVDGTAVKVSNFVLPAYFTDDAMGNPVDHLKTLDETFAIAPGGYQIQMKAGSVHNVFGARFSDALRAGKAASHGRTFWRHVTMALVMQDD